MTAKEEQARAHAEAEQQYKDLCLFGEQRPLSGNTNYD